MNFRIRFTPDTPACSIVKTGAALGDDVYGSLKMARVALEERVVKHNDATKAEMKRAIKVREEKLPVEPVAEPALGEVAE